MAKLKTIKRKITPIASRLNNKNSFTRTTGRTLQKIRLSFWLKDPHCSICGNPVGHPEGYELDHIIPLFKGGKDEDQNRQILCVDRGDIEGCHTKKTREDLKI